jgi:hypothetical protein
MSVPLARVLLSLQQLIGRIPQGRVEFAWTWEGRLAQVALQEGGGSKDWLMPVDEAHSLHTVLYRSAHELLRARVQGSFAVAGALVRRPGGRPGPAWALWLTYSYDLLHEGSSTKPRTENPERLLELHLARLGGQRWRQPGKLHFLLPLPGQGAPRA